MFIFSSSSYFFLPHANTQDEIGLKEWAQSLRSAHKLSQELLGSMARKAGKIYGTEREAKTAMISSSAGPNVPSKNANGSN